MTAFARYGNCEMTYEEFCRVATRTDMERYRAMKKIPQIATPKHYWVYLSEDENFTLYLPRSSSFCAYWLELGAPIGVNS